jgi:hypothetical protein
MTVCDFRECVAELLDLDRPVCDPAAWGRQHRLDQSEFLIRRVACVARLRTHILLDRSRLRPWRIALLLAEPANRGRRWLYRQRQEDP